jgi:hypothetical protein
MDRPNYKRSRNDKRALERNTKTESGRIEMAEDFSVVVYPHLWKRLKDDEDGKIKWKRVT